MIWLWIRFVGIVLGMLALNSGVFHHKAHVISVKKARVWPAMWLAMGLAFPVFVCLATGTTFMNPPIFPYE